MSGIENISYAHSFRSQRIMRDTQNPLDYLNDDQFKERFRLRRHVFLLLLSKIEGAIFTSCPKKASPIPAIQVLICLQYLSTNKFQLSIADEFNISQATISRIVYKVSRVISSLARTEINMQPRSLSDVKNEFYSIAHFPGVVGALDCSHVPIISPGGIYAELYRNRKGYFSVNIQAVCDANLIFTNMVARWYGSAHDSRIFHNSALRDDLENGVLNGIILGDNGYPCKRYLMTPFLNPQTPAEIRFNRAHKKTRNKIECAFGVWKRRFPVLSTPIRIKLTSVPYIILGTAVLHNFARRHNDYDFSEHSLSTETEIGDSVSEIHVGHQPDSETGRGHRNHIVQMHFSNANL